MASPRKAKKTISPASPKKPEKAAAKKKKKAAATTTTTKLGWGGARPGAGRKPRDPSRPRVPHVKRVVQDGRTPLEVILRAMPGLPAFDGPRLARLVGEVIQDIRAKEYKGEFRILDVKVRPTALHLVVRASSIRDRRGHSPLRSGTSAVAIAFARRLNMMLGRKGKVWEIRYEVTPVAGRAAAAKKKRS